MIKKIVFFLILFSLFLIFFLLIYLAPYHIYTLTLTEGINTSFLHMNPSRLVLYDGKKIEIPAFAEFNDMNLYKLFHFNHFLLPLPYNHPLFFLIPEIKLEGKGPLTGISYQNSKGQDLFYFLVESSFKVNLDFGEQKLFLLPIFKKYISNKSSRQIWTDIFSKQLSLPSNQGRSFYESYLELKKVSYYELVYNLYILYNRHHLISGDVNEIYFIEEKNLGVVELKSPNEKYRIERLYFIDKGMVHPIKIKTFVANQSAQNLRSKLIRETEYKMNGTDSAIPIYAGYKQLTYSERVGQKGMTYLFSAWTHDVENKDFIRVIILFLERGELNLKYLTPFYKYAFRKFGTTMSSLDEHLDETAPEALKRKNEKGLEDEVRFEEKNKANADSKIEDPDEVVESYLRKAKENQKSYKKNKELLMD